MGSFHQQQLLEERKEAVGRSRLGGGHGCPIPAADELFCRGNWACGKLLEFFYHCPLGASVELSEFTNGELFILQGKELPTLQQELTDAKQALAVANQDKEKLLQEIRKYNPLFEL